MRKSGTLFFLLVATFLVIVFVAMQFAPRPYKWEESFSPHDSQPFGSVLFDSLMRSSMPNGYEVRNETADSFSLEETQGGRSVLIIADQYHTFPYSECEAMLEMADRGDNVMLVSADPYDLCQYLGYGLVSREWFDYRDVKNQIKKYGHAVYDTLYLPQTKIYPACKVPVLSSMTGCKISCDTIKYYYDEIATWRNGSNPEDGSGLYKAGYYGSPVAIRVYYGSGCVYIVTPSLCFTNYGMLDSQCRTFVLRMMNELSDYPVVRLYDSEKVEEVYGAYGPLDFFYRNDSLRFAWQMFFAGCVLLLVVNARRRQRGIPLWEKGVNATADFLNQHASLYRKRTDHAPLLRRRFRVFTAELQRLWRVDVSETSPALWRGEAKRLASYLGKPVAEVMGDLEKLEVLRKWSGHVSPQMFRKAMGLMEKLTPKK